NLQASRASDTETLQSQVNKAAKKRLSLSGLEILHGRLDSVRDRLMLRLSRRLQTSRWMPMLQRAANTEPRPSSAWLPLAGPWPRPTVGPLDFRLAVMTLQTESSRRSTTTGEKCHPRPRHCLAV